MDSAVLEYLDEARQRIIAAIAAARGGEDSEAAVQIVQAAFSQVLPRIPAMIGDRLGPVDARIYTRAQMERYLAEFAVDILTVQTGDFLRAVLAPDRGGQ